MPNNLPTRVRIRPGPTPAPAPMVAIAHPNRHELLAEIRRGHRAGEYGTVSAVHRTPAGQYAVKVQRLKDPPPRWRKPLIIGVVAAAAAGVLVALICSVLSALAAAISPAIVGGAVLIGVLLAAGSIAGGGKIVEVLVRVRVR